ncbi:hypothetical protein M3221_07075 [Domibacillus indicus]|uniref:hypothetical protein n=1 Tax=Domibacillus indicus TaxID=1437523 RepID=UPI002041D02E|nr:hypothetical protein [Domibacillus indicus]MCM3788161.1 hypothetical protein [Domibacillus indicus]
MIKRYLVFILFITAIYYVWLFSFENDEWAKTLGSKILSIVAPGIALYPQPEQLIQKADAAMYAVKQSGKGAYQFYTKEKRRMTT